MATMRVAVIDDDWFRREQMRAVLGADHRVEVVEAVDHDTAAGWDTESCRRIDVAIVDVVDDRAAIEHGTDMYSGIVALGVLSAAGVRTIAVTVHRAHPLIEQRIFQAGANHTYRRWDLNSPQQLLDAVLVPDDGHITRSVPKEVLREFGAARANTNTAVAIYERSGDFAGKIRPRRGFKSFGVSRWTFDKFVESIRGTRFVAPPKRARLTGKRAANWIDVRDYLLVLLGRKDAEPSDREHR